MNICIIGGGPTGLTAGYELIKKGHRISIYECEERCGRLVDTVQIGNKKLEKFYHHLFTSDSDIIKLIDELNLSSGLSWISPKNGIYINSRLYSLSSPSDLLLFKELSFAERLSLGNLLLKALLITNWKKLESVTAREWVVKHSGENVYKKVWEPLLYSKFDQDAEQISAVWLWNRIKLRSSTRRKTLMSEVLGYLNGSFQVLYEKLASKIKERGGTIECSKCVSRITPKGDRSLEVICDNQKENFERVIITSAPSLMRDLGLPLPGWYLEKLEKIKYKANICMIVELTRPLSPYYWITVAEKDFPFIAVIEHTNLVSFNGYGCSVVYLSRYIDDTSDLFLSSDEMVRERFINCLKRMFPQWDETTIVNVHVNRARYVQPVICTGYSQIIPRFKTPIDNVYLASMAQIYPRDRGQSNAIKMGKSIARIVDSSESN